MASEGIGPARAQAERLLAVEERKLAILRQQRNLRVVGEAPVPRTTMAAVEERAVKKPSASRAGGRAGSPGGTPEGWANWHAAQEQLRALEGASAQKQAAVEGIDAMGRLGKAVDGIREKQRKATDSTFELSDATKQAKLDNDQYQATMEATAHTIQSTVSGAFADLAGSLWMAADAAVQGGQSFGVAVGRMTKAILMGVAQQATVLSMMELAKATSLWFTGPIAAGHLKAAGMFAAVAVAAGGVGLGMSAGGVGVGSGAGASGSMGASSAARGSRSFGRTADGDTVVHVHIEIPSAKSGAAMYVTDKVLTARAKRAA
jgi:hypothetical protein